YEEAALQTVLNSLREPQTFSVQILSLWTSRKEIELKQPLLGKRMEDLIEIYLEHEKKKFNQIRKNKSRQHPLLLYVTWLDIQRQIWDIYSKFPKEFKAEEQPAFSYLETALEQVEAEWLARSEARN